MTRSRDGIYFNYSDLVTKEYKDELESIVTLKDRFNDAKTYTPYVGSFLATTVAAVQFGLGNPTAYALVFNLLLTLIPAATGGLTVVSSKVENNYATKGNRLIDIGVKLNFFNEPPDRLPTTDSTENTVIDVNPPNMQADAIKHRVFGKK